MSDDYPNRATWLAKRNTPRGQTYERLVRPMPAGGPTKDPARFHAQRRRKGPLVSATGPGSINAESEMQALVRAGKADEAAAFYEACFRVHYKTGKPKMRWGARWYAEYKRSKLTAHGVVA